MTQRAVVQCNSDTGVDDTVLLAMECVGGEGSNAVSGEVAVGIRRRAVDVEFVTGSTAMVIKLPFSCS